MPFTFRAFRRFPVCCPVTYHAGLFDGQGVVWNLSVNGWRLSGDLPLRVGELCALAVSLPTQPRIDVAESVVWCVREAVFGVGIHDQSPASQARVRTGVRVISKALDWSRSPQAF
jgi:hypothetical protein